jgi:hypothetical protein
MKSGSDSFNDDSYGEHGSEKYKRTDESYSGISDVICL